MYLEHAAMYFVLVTYPYWEEQADVSNYTYLLDLHWLASIDVIRTLTVFNNSEFDTVKLQQLSCTVMHFLGLQCHQYQQLSYLNKSDQREYIARICIIIAQAISPQLPN